MVSLAKEEADTQKEGLTGTQQVSGDTGQKARAPDRQSTPGPACTQAS